MKYKMSARLVKKMPKGIIIFSILLIFYSIWDLKYYLSFANYSFLFQPLPDQFIFIRYIFSILLRSALLVSGIGILIRKDIFRRIILWTSLFTIITIYWKHPAICFKNIIARLAERGMVPVDLMAANDTIVRILVGLNCVIDAGFAICLAYYFTRPGVKQQFR